MPRGALTGGLLALVCLGCHREPSRGLPVLRVMAGGAFDRGGFAVGDRLLSFERAAVGGTPAVAALLISCLEVSEAENEQSPRGAVTIELLRRGQPLRLAVPVGEWRIEVADGPPQAAETAVCRDLDAARRAYPERQWEAADAAFERAARSAGELADGRWLALVRQRQGLTRLAAGDLAGARLAITEGLQLRQRWVPGSLAESASWHALGVLAQRQGELAEADAAFARARALRERLAPQSLDLAWTLTNLGIDAYQRQDTAGAETLYLEALAIIERQRPGSVEMAGMLTNLGLLARENGNLALAEQRLEAARSLYAALEPDGENEARNRVNLSTVAMDRGDLARAEQLLQDALARFSHLAPESLEVAQVYENLGKVARDRGQYSAAETFLRRSLALRRESGAGSAAEARSLSPLAWVLFRQGRLGEAEATARRVLELVKETETAAPDQTPEASSSLQTLAEISAARGEVEQALPLMERAMQFKRSVIPGSLRLAIGLETYGELLGRGGRLVQAQAVLAEAVELLRGIAPDSFQLARALAGLAGVEQAAGEVEAAATAYRAGVAAVEAQLSRLGGAEEGQASFDSEFADLYRRWLALELHRGRPQVAFEVLERSRGRSLLAELRRRDLAWSRDLPPAAREGQREIELAYDRAQRELAETDTAQSGLRREALQVELARLRSLRAAWQAEVGRSFPRLAALQDGGPVDLGALSRALDRGSRWVSYSVSPDEVWAFVVGPPGEGPSLAAVPLPTTGRALADEVALYRSLLLRGRFETAPSPALDRQAERLYQLLVGPLGGALTGAERLLISPEGPLHLLPFAALRGPDGRYLVERWPTATVASARVYLELVRRPRPEALAAATRSLAFVAPAYPTAPAAAPSPEAGRARPTAALERYRAGLPALPGALAEGRALAEVMGSRLDLLVGSQAEEARAKALRGRLQVLHFASHALLDASSPLDSGLALAAPSALAEGGENGLLQAWEIFDQLRVEADLVTLSACETAIGLDGGGEGLLGLSRAFQYAGARAVLASLWQVSDRSAVALMRGLYRRRTAGARLDAALAEAQCELLTLGQGEAHPYHWAAFALNGDPR